ncbi:MAG TPA: ABC transporter ATP-binding protein [Methylocystis sp.]|nr:ABC transporter ATP-binding protein [Methylocystis sp.]
MSSTKAEPELGPADPIVVVSNLEKVYAGGFQALKSISLEVRAGEIFALLGPNGAGKTTLIGAIAGLVRPTSGTITVDGFDTVRDYRAARAKIGLVPQELSTDMFSRVRESLAFSRGLFGLAPDPAHLEKVLRDLSLWDKRDNKIMTLSGGMKRRLLIAKALAHEPRILFLDEPTAGVDVELRRDMWAMIRRLREQGVTIILTTHYLEEAEDMADRIGVIDRGEIVLVEEKSVLMRRLGQTTVTIGLKQPLEAAPPGLTERAVQLSEDGLTLSTTFSGADDGQNGGAADLIRRLAASGVDFASIDMHRSSLEEIFVNLVGRRA